MAGPCGIDFGTSNSSVGVTREGGAKLVELQEGATAVPTALFFSFEDDTITFGREAMARYRASESGRLLRSIKTLLGTSLYEEMTQVRTRRYHFSEIVSSFLAFLRAAGTGIDAEPLDKVVLGRPVFFVDDNPPADLKAQEQLEAAARAAGFEAVAFQLEPIAAALDYEQTTTREEIALVADIGGGTSDFSLVRVGPNLKNKSDRRDDVLGCNGVRVGGTDFDRQLSLATLMPFLGRHSRLKTKGLETPSWYYADLGTWHRINALYERKVVTEIRGLLRDATEPEKIERLLAVLELRKGHDLLGRVEGAKIALSDDAETAIDLADVVETLHLPVSREQLEEAIDDGLLRIESRIRTLLQDAGVSAANVGTVFITGGSSGIPAVRDAITSGLAGARVIAGDAFGSVATGLALDAARRFGSN